MPSKEASDWLGARLAEERKAVETAEAKLQQYREQNDAISLEDRENIIVQKLADLNAAVTRAKTERIQKEAMYQQLQAIAGRPGAARHFPGDPDQRLHPAAEGGAGGAAAPVRAVVGEARRQAPGHHQAQVGDPGCRRPS